MSLPVWREESIARAHLRTEFDCGVPALNEYLVRFARQNHKLGSAKTFVAGPVDEPARILGYYSISSASLAYYRVPHAVTKGLARHEVPAFRLGRLATDRRVQGLGLGGQLLLAAGARALAVAAQVGGVVLTIDAKDKRASAWYQGFGALPLLDDPRTLVLPLATVARALGS